MQSYDRKVIYNFTSQKELYFFLKRILNVPLSFQLLSVFSYWGCLGQRERIRQVTSNSGTRTYLPASPAFLTSFFFVVVVWLHVLVKNNSGVKPAGQCGTWVKEPEGGLFTSPNYPSKYPPDTECVYILEGKSVSAVNTQIFAIYSNQMVALGWCHYFMWWFQAAIFKHAQLGFDLWAHVIKNGRQKRGNELQGEVLRAELAGSFERVGALIMTQVDRSFDGCVTHVLLPLRARR